jgi:hypothetical protein
MTKHDDRSPALPTDPFDQAIAQLTGLPNGAHTQPAVVQHTDFYGKTTSYMVQTFKWDQGETVFVTEVDAEGRRRFMVPPKVLATILRQRDALSTMVRRRQGRRLAEERKAAGIVSTFTPEMRAKALATRKRKAALRRKKAARS